MTPITRDEQEQIWEILLEVASDGERHGLNSELITPYYLKLLEMLATHDAAKRAELEEELPYKKSLLADLAYQGPDLPKKYKLEIMNYYKGFNEAIDQFKAAIDKVYKP